MVWVKPFQPIMTRWLKNRNSSSRLCERCVFLSTCKWCTRCVCRFLFLLRGSSNTGRQHDHGRRGGGHQRGEIWTLRTFFLLLGSVQVCSSSHTLLIYLSKPETYDGGATRLFLSGKYDQVMTTRFMFSFKRFHHWHVSWRNITKDHIFLTTRIFFQDTLDIKLPQGFALVFQQKGMLHAGLGNLKHMSDIKWLLTKQDHLRMNVAPDLNNHIRSIDLFRSMIIKKNRSKAHDSLWIVIR